MDLLERKVVDVEVIEKLDDLTKARFTLDNGEQLEAYVRFLFDDEPVDKTKSYE